MDTSERVGVEANQARWLTAWTLSCLIAAAPAAASAQAASDGLQSTFAIDDADPERSVPSRQDALRNPLQMGYWTMLVSDRAAAAEKRGDHTAALKYYRALARAVPDRAVAFTKMCKLYEALGDGANALSSCRIALGKGGATVDDSARFIRLLLAKESALSASETADADAVIAHIEDTLAEPAAPADPAHTLGAGAALLVQQLRCELGVRLEDARRLEACTKALAMLAPRDPRTVTFDWALALLQRDFEEAEQVVARARKLGLPEDAVDRMAGRLRFERERSPLWVRAAQRAGAWLAALAAFVLLAFAAFIVRRRAWRRRGLAQAV